MPAKDMYHDVAKNALIKEGWSITDDPLFIKQESCFVFSGAVGGLQ